MKLVIFGESHVVIYNSIKSLIDSFDSINIHHCDAEDSVRYTNKIKMQLKLQCMKYNILFFNNLLKE